MSTVWLNQKVKKKNLNNTKAHRSTAQNILSLYGIWRYSISLGTLLLIKESFEQIELV